MMMILVVIAAALFGYYIGSAHQLQTLASDLSILDAASLCSQLGMY